MASASTSKKVREEATCSICLHLMAEPVSISCGHSYCQACLLRFMGPSSSPRRQQYRETFSCPQCRASCHRGSLRPNKQLGSLIAALREQEQEQQQQEQEQEQELSCQEHGERLHLFCEDDGQLICWRCERDGQHKGHNTVLVEDASTGYREKLQEAVRKLRQLEEECTNQKAITATQIAQWEDVKGALSRSQAVRLVMPEAVSLEIEAEYKVPEVSFDPRKGLSSHQGT
ncbi:E3 ubiquitin-protein ligase TRIM38-like [Myotis lucifugus]|uniref:E3 ubiquitin-protein ligase TRIM38-like n=1 Tax=Myotis lucifugus TaxID=59463 RepID=UPI000CCC1CCC|nr:E3 ubiquitin-protein ligase TRIM38-like [Myotis lucifugus]